MNKMDLLSECRKEIYRNYCKKLNDVRIKWKNEHIDFLNGFEEIRKKHTDLFNRKNKILENNHLLNTLQKKHDYLCNKYKNMNCYWKLFLFKKTRLNRLSNKIDEISSKINKTKNDLTKDIQLQIDEVVNNMKKYIEEHGDGVYELNTYSKTLNCLESKIPEFKGLLSWDNFYRNIKIQFHDLNFKDAVNVLRSFYKVEIDNREL